MIAKLKRWWRTVGLFSDFLRYDPSARYELRETWQSAKFGARLHEVLQGRERPEGAPERQEGDTL